MNYQPLTYIYQPSQIPEAYTLLLLHGNGGDECDLLPLANEFGRDLNVLSVRGNVVEGGNPHFFRRLGMGIFDEKEVAFRTRELVHFLRNVAEKEGFDVEKIIAFGYCNGASITGAILMLYPDLLAGAVLLRPIQPLAEKYTFKTPRHQPVFFSFGKRDSTVDSQAASKYSELLLDNGFKVSRYNLHAGHELAMEDIALAVEWYQSNFSKPYERV